MATGEILRSDLNRIHHVVQNTQLSRPKELVIGVLRDEFSKDSYYHYVADEWGFPKIPDHTDLAPDAGLEDDLTTRIFIGEAFKQEITYYPAILIKGGSSKSTPISINRNKETVLHETVKVIDGYGNEQTVAIPTHFLLAGAWEGNLTLDIQTRDILSRDELATFCSLLFEDIRYEELRRAGVLIKSGGVSVGAPSEGDDRRQEKLYKQTITINIRTEWRREIPIDNVVDAISFCIDFGRVDVEPFTPAPNLTITSTVELVNQIDSL
jgi:hypothetical protein